VRNFKHLFSYRSQNTEWQDAVIARLDSLAAAQNDLRKQLADHAADGRPTSGARVRGAIYLAITALLITFSVSALILSPTYQSKATIAFNQAQASLEQTNKDLQPIETAESKYGSKYIVDHANKAWLADLQAAQGPAKQYSQDNAEGSRFESESFFSEYFGQTVLAISSACFGAIAGWLLVPVLVRGRLRRRNPTASGGDRVESSPSS
jgi:hypothetical protein